MKNGRCRLHGGLSTGAKTAEGLERIRKAVTKHGRYSTFSGDFVVTEVHVQRLTLHAPENVRVSFALTEAKYSYVDDRDAMQIFEQTVRLSNQPRRVRGTS